MPNRHHGPPKRRLPMTWHAHNNHTPPLHAHPWLRRRDSAAPTGGFTTIDAPPRRVAGVSQPYGRNSPRAPAHTRQQRVWPQPTRPATTANPAPTGGPATTKHSHQPTPTGGFTTIDTPPRRVAGVSQPYGRNSPHAPDEPKVACNSGARTFYSTPKRCNSNGAISTFEIYVGELRATFLRNHNMRRHKDPSRRHPKPGRQLKHRRPPQPRQPPQPPQARGHCTRYVAVHPLRGGAPVTWRCTWG